MRPNTKVIVINFLHSPTGAQLSPTVDPVDRDRGAHGALFSDRSIASSSAPRLATAAEQSARGISLASCPKRSARRHENRLDRDAGQRAPRIGRLKDYTTICNSAERSLRSSRLRDRGRMIRSIIRENSPRRPFFLETPSGFVRPRAGSVGFTP
jgi:hypothetical protein